MQAYQEEVQELYPRGKSLLLFLVEPVDVREIVWTRFVAYRWKVSGENRLSRYVEVRSLKPRKDTQSHEHRHIWRQSCSDREEEKDNSASYIRDSLASDLRCYQRCYELAQGFDRQDRRVPK